MFNTKLLKTEKYFKPRNARILAVGIGACLLLLVLKGRVLLHLLGLDEVANMALFFLLGFGAISIFRLFVAQKHTAYGQLQLTGNQIIVDINSSQKSYDLNSLTDISIIRSPYYAGELEGGARDYFFRDNWLQFDYMQTLYKFEFAIDSHYKSSQLLKVLEVWELNGVAFHFKQQEYFLRLDR